MKNYTESNRMAWNQTMPKHQEANGSSWDDRFSTPGFSALSDPELQHLKNIGVRGKSIAHLCCNNGVELMSLKNLGAGRCVGFDISDMAVAEANNRAEKFGMECEFIRTDVYEISGSFDHEFDLVYISIGCLGWMPDITTFMKVVSRLLKTSGKLFIYEQHPFAEMLSDDGDTEADPLKIVDPYFKSEPYVDTDGIDYLGKTTYKSHVSYWFVWTLSDILTAVLQSGLKIECFNEYMKDISASHQRNEHAGIPIPLSYILVAGKDPTKAIE
ncbi:MAG: class I SAM-dependent methyltransferase [Kiritimatiellae bacterium]|jgi:ubiquinone/menaquinone biosynthesis C-methylase UbiE|nr:class I SAM-dependent methyltransferase [Kiritimatiellia bacterium]